MRPQVGHDLLTLIRGQLVAVVAQKKLDAALGWVRSLDKDDRTIARAVLHIETPILKRFSFERAIRRSRWRALTWGVVSFIPASRL